MYADVWDPVKLRRMGNPPSKTRRGNPALPTPASEVPRVCKDPARPPLDSCKTRSRIPDVVGPQGAAVQPAFSVTSEGLQGANALVKVAASHREASRWLLINTSGFSVRHVLERARLPLRSKGEVTGNHVILLCSRVIRETSSFCMSVL